MLGATGTSPSRFALSARSISAVLVGMLAGCSGGGSLPPAPTGVVVPGSDVAVSIPSRAYDVLRGGPCELSADGLVWYAVASSTFPPIAAAHARCKSASTLDTVAAPPIPSWGRPSGPTKA
ncbi:MAG: hypothetical protein ABI346_04455, partial [Candidatus Baltobacteraceae bacterium]